MRRIERSNKSAAHDNFTTPKKADSAQAQGIDDQGRVVEQGDIKVFFKPASTYSSSQSPVPETPVTPPGQRIAVVQTDAPDPEQSPAVSSSTPQAQGRDEKGRAVKALDSGKVIDIPSSYSSSQSSVPETPVTPPGQRIAVVQTGASDPEQSSAISSPVPYIPHEEEEEDTPVAGVVRRLDLGNAGQNEVSANSVAVDSEPLETPASRRNEKALPLFEALEKARDHFPLDDELSQLYKELHEHALSMRKLNQHPYKGNYIKIFNVVEEYRRDKRKKVTYKLNYTDEARKALADESVAGEVFSRRFSDIQDEVNKLIKEAKKKIYDLREIDEQSQKSPSKKKKSTPRPSPIRVRVEKSTETGKGSGLDEAFKTSEAEYFFYCTAGLVAEKEWCSVTKEGQEITWLDLQRDARVPTKKSILTDGMAHIGALYSQLSVSLEGKTKFEGQLIKGQGPYHNNRQAQIKKSSTPLKALYRAYKFMKKALINRSTFAKGDVFAEIAGTQITYNTRSATVPGAPKVSKGVFTVDGKNLVDRGTRLEQVNVLLISLRRAINGVLRAIKNERDDKKEDAKSVLSIGSNDTVNSVFTDAEFRHVEEQHYPETYVDTHKNKQAADKQKAPPKRSKDDMDSNSNVEQHYPETDDNIPENEQVADEQKAPPKRSKDDMDSNSNVKKKNKKI